MAPGDLAVKTAAELFLLQRKTNRCFSSQAVHIFSISNKELSLENAAYVMYGYLDINYLTVAGLIQLPNMKPRSKGKTKLVSGKLCTT